MVKISPISEESIAEAAEALRAGALIAFPTETVYGLGADATNDRAVAEIFAAKGRPNFNPLIVHLPDRGAAEAFVTFNEMAGLLADRFWPGALTLVLPTLVKLPAALLKDGRVGVRLPDDPICRRLILQFGRPITGTSANVTGQPPAMTADEVTRMLGSKVDYVLEAGRAQGGTPSTVLSLGPEGARVLRKGAIPDNTLLDTLKALGVSASVA